MNPAWQSFSQLGGRFESKGSAADRQECWLLDCLDRNRATSYGERFHFGKIRSISDFREHVPIVSYDDVEPYALRMAGGETDVLFAGHPIAFERTGGSTQGSKLIPYSQHSLADFQSALLPWLANCIDRFGITSGTAYFSISPATRQAEVSESGIPIGLADGAYLGTEALSAFAQISSVPPWVGTLRSIDDWQLATLYWLLRRDDLALISVWSPTFLLTLLDALPRRGGELARLLQRGGALSGHELAADPAAHSRLARFTSSGDALSLWPHLKLVSCWADASSRPFFTQLQQQLSQAAFEGKGLLSTEGVVTVPDCAGRPVLAADSGFFEFLSENGDLYLASEVVERKQYEVIMTTSGGLYRYRTGDCVTSEGFVEGLPVLRFSGRKGLTSDIVGEKLDEGFVLSCLQDVPGFCMLVPVHAPKSRYTLVVDDRLMHEPAALVDSVEARLSQNPQYAYARSIGQLEKLALYEASQPLNKYLERLATAGARLGDLKVTALRPETDWMATFSGTVT